MKRICNFITRNSPSTMKKKRVTPSSLDSKISSKQNQKPMKRTKNKINKHTRNRKNLFFFDKLVCYLLSDSYMYNPLVSPQPTFDFPPHKQILSTLSFSGGQQDVALPVKGRNRKFIEKVVHFLETDCYLYSPLLTHNHISTKKDPSSGHLRNVEETTNTETRATVATAYKTVAFHESVKHAVHQNGRSKPIQGGVSVGR